MDNGTRYLIDELDELARNKLKEMVLREAQRYEDPFELSDLAEYRAARRLETISKLKVEEARKLAASVDKETQDRIADLERRLLDAKPWRNQLVLIPRKMKTNFAPENIAGNIEHALDFSECSDEFTRGARSAISAIARYLTEHREETYEHYRKEVHFREEENED